MNDIKSFNYRERRRTAYASAVALILFLILFLIGIMAPKASAHGVSLSYDSSEGVEVTAEYDNGEPVSEGQVSVYSPDELSETWSTGTCDDEGKFFFVPDTEIPGTWQVKVRKAGHGGIINIEVEEGAVESGGSTGFSVLQIVIMSLAVIWGFVGTGLYFARRKDNAHS